MSADSGRTGLDVVRLPRLTLPAGQVAYRIHSREHRPWWFSADGRFGLTGPRGTCYLTLEPLGAYIETLGRFGAPIYPANIAARRLSAVLLPNSVELVDLRPRTILGAGLHPSISMGDDYSRSQTLAADVDTGGLGGIIYPLSHDSEADLTGIALFDRSGAQPHLPVLGTGPISDALIGRAVTEFGLTVWQGPANTYPTVV